MIMNMITMKYRYCYYDRAAARVEKGGASRIAEPGDVKTCLE